MARTSKNQRSSVIGKNSKPQVAPDVTLVQLLGGGEFFRVFVPSTGKSIHGPIGSERVVEALAVNVADGYGPRMAAQVPAFASFPAAAAAIVSATVVADDADLC